MSERPDQADHDELVEEHEPAEAAETEAEAVGSRRSSGRSGGRSGGRSDRASRKLAVARAREAAARAVWGVCVALALVMAIAAFTYALEANGDNALVTLARDLADSFDLQFFDLDNPVKEFSGDNAETKTALFNYGLAAVFYLLVGRVLERLVRP